MAAREAKENEYNEYQIPCAAVAIATAMPAAAEDGETVTPYFNLAISNIPGKSLFVQFVDQCRGGASASHAHAKSAFVFAYVLSGEIDSQVNEFFYGPGTWYPREGDIGDQVRQQQVPIIGEGQGVYSFVHIDDAAGATAAALDCPPGAYNIVDGNPSPQHLWLTAFARAAGAPAPPRVSEEEALRASGRDAVYYATRLRGASNEKARRELDFRPRPLEWILDQRSD
uniref:Uncharacterized protein n=1 Tax=Bradyrhizobium barranii subsp. barranii TaxID=2823807 RepID=A0A939M380_9BRAD